MPEPRTSRDRRASRTRRAVVSIALLSLIVGLGSTSPRAATIHRQRSAPKESSSVALGRSPERAPRWPREPHARARPHLERTKAPRSSPRRAPARPSGRPVAVPGGSRVHGSGPLLRFEVLVEGGLGIRPRAFAATVEEVLFSPRGWTRGTVSFQRVSGVWADFQVVLASPRLTDALCAPALTRGRFSCHNDGRVVINLWRWMHGADSYRGRLDRYRAYVVNHEVGHALGRGHVACPGPGERAPVMMQQTIGVGGCRPSPWPGPSELP